MEPVLPTQSTTTEASAPSGGVLAKAKGAIGGFFAVGSPDSSQTTTGALPTLDTPPVPGLKPRTPADLETTLGTAVMPPTPEPTPIVTPKPITAPAPFLASVPEPQFSPGIGPAASRTITGTIPEPRPTIESAPALDSLASVTPEATPPAIITPEPEAVMADATPVQPDSSVWTPDPIAEPVSDGVAPADYAAAGEEAFRKIAESGTPTAETPEPEQSPAVEIDPDMRPISAPSVGQIPPDGSTSVNPDAYTAPVGAGSQSEAVAQSTSAENNGDTSQVETTEAVSPLSNPEIIKIRQFLSMFDPTALGPEGAKNDQTNPEPAVSTPTVDLSLTPPATVTDQPQSRII